MKPTRTLALCHVVFLIAVAFYLRTFHPRSESVVLLLCAAGFISELLPRWLKRAGAPDILLLTVAVFCWFKLIPNGATEAIHGFVGMILAYIILIPSRVGVLKWLLSLVILELLLMARLPGGGTAYLWALPIGLAALAVDGWLLDIQPTQLHALTKPRLFASLFRWALLPAAVIAVLAMLFGGLAVEERAWEYARADWLKNSKLNTEDAAMGLEETMSIGDHDSVVRDPRIAARLTWEVPPPPTDTFYLRAMALSELALAGNTLAWQPSQTANRDALPVSPNKFAYWGSLERLASRSDAVLLPDGEATAELEGMEIDPDGNIARPQLGAASQTYRVGFDNASREADPETAKQYSATDPRLDSLPWAQIEQPLWRNLRPELAAKTIITFLNQRCRYDVEKLPPPAPGVAGVLRTFLFAETEVARRGHCQYFATSAVILLRRAGHSARCVAGFASNEFDRRGVTFRGLHAHAWIEVINSQGRWQRFDPTPPARNTRITAGIDLARDAAKPEDKSAPESPLPAVQKRLSAAIDASRDWAQLLIPALALAAVLKLLAYLRSPRAKKRDPRLIELTRRNDDLFQLATTLGIAITPATTLSQIVGALEQRTGLPLGTHLEAHLAARFGSGPIPEPWPLAELQSRAR